MRAAIVSPDPSATALRIARLPRPRPQPRWAVVRLRAAALNQLDRMMLQDRASLGRESVLGSDGAGVVHAIGRDVTTVAPGDEVVISPSLFWGDDPTHPGPDYEILGSPTDGTHAEYVVVPAANLAPKPTRLSWEEAAALPTAGVTAWRALVTRGGLTRGETVVVGAAGSGVGTFAVQIAKALGARVIAVTSEPRADMVRKLGADVVVLRTGDDLGSALADAARSADVALDPTGALWQPLAEALRPAGRLVVVGKAATDVGTLRVQILYWKQLDLRGSSMGSPADFAAFMDHVRGATWSPHVDSVFPLAQVADAYERLNAPARVGKVVLSPITPDQTQW
jgi:NADPH:quinone reductase-like Zn-dependent oxidoreductase